MYKHKLIFENQMFEDGTTVPANTSTTIGDTTALRVDGTRSRMAVTVLAKTTVAIADTKTLTISLKECATEDGTFAAPTPDSHSVVITMSGATAYAVGDRIASLILPENIGEWVKPVISTNDAAASGTIDVIIEYLGG